MLHSLMASQCLQLEIPDALVSICHAVCSAITWLVTNDNEVDISALNAVFALNAGFASIDYFSHGIMRILRKSLRKKLSEYGVDEWSKSAGTKLETKETLNDLADRVVKIQDSLPDRFGAIAKRWKFIMAACAGISLVLMVIPYHGRIVIILALPVLLFANKCRKKKNEIMGELSCIDSKRDEIVKSSHLVEKKINTEMIDRIGNLERAISSLVSANDNPDAKPRQRKPKPKKK